MVGRTRLLIYVRRRWDFILLLDLHFNHYSRLGFHQHLLGIPCPRLYPLWVMAI